MRPCPRIGPFGCHLADRDAPRRLRARPAHPTCQSNIRGEWNAAGTNKELQIDKDDHAAVVRGHEVDPVFRATHSSRSIRSKRGDERYIGSLEEIAWIATMPNEVANRSKSRLAAYEAAVVIDKIVVKCDLRERLPISKRNVEFGSVFKMKTSIFCGWPTDPTDEQILQGELSHPSSWAKPSRASEPFARSRLRRTAFRELQQAQWPAPETCVGAADPP